MTVEKYKLPRALSLAEQQIERCIERTEFFKVKSTASYAKDAARNWQHWMEQWSNIHDLLLELEHARKLREEVGMEHWPE